MARRPAAPSPRSSGLGRRSQDREVSPHSDETSQDRVWPAAEKSARTPSPASPSSPGSPSSQGSPGSPAEPSSSSRTPSPSSRTSPSSRMPATASGEESGSSGSTVVAAAERFRFGRRPWLRHRRTVLLSVLGVVVLLVAVVVCGLTLPQLKVQEVQVQGAGYVDGDDIQQAAEPHLGSSILLAPTQDVARAVESVPGVQSAEVTRGWPDKLSVRITERTPLAKVSNGSGDPEIIDADGVVLPAAAADEDTPLVPLTLAKGTKDEEGTRHAMLEVLAALPKDLRAQVTKISASTPSDVSLKVEASGDDDGAKARTKTVVWGDAEDSELKAEVTATLLDQPGTTIDVSSPVAPITR